MTPPRHIATSRRFLTKVPEITLWFWIVKVLCTTVGETAADFLNVSLNLGLSGTSVVTGILLAGALILQFAAGRYIPARYWLTVTLVSVFGTLVTDNLTDTVGLPLEASTLIFAGLLALTFLAWYRSERTLSIHSITTRRREAFYWLAILFTFALGTATGDLMSEVLGLGYLVAGIIVAAMIAATAIAWRLGLHGVLAFWVIYVLTRPLGASIGDYLAQPGDQGGLGLGATTTSVTFLVGIAGIVGYLAVTKVDVITAEAAVPPEESSPGAGLRQTVVVVALIVAVAGIGYGVRAAALRNDATAPPTAAQPIPGAPAVASLSPLGDLSPFRTVTQDTLALLNAGDQSGATGHVDDLETTWDNAQARLQVKNKAAWTAIDGRIDTVLRELRSANPKPDSERAALTALLTALG